MQLKQIVTPKIDSADLFCLLVYKNKWRRLSIMKGVINNAVNNNK